MNYIVLDLEWNQSRHPRETVEKPLHLSGEIIQIGAVRLNEKFVIKKELRLAVMPQYYKKVHRKVAQITGVTEADLKRGLPFPKALKKLQKFCGKDVVFLTWGPDDIPMLRDNMILHGISTDDLPRTYDLQVIFADQIAKEKRQFSLSLAMEMLGEKEFVAHDALNDAHSTALVCRHLNMEKGLADYPTLCEEISSYPVDSQALSVNFLSKGEAMKELSYSPFSSPDGNHYLTTGELIPQNPSKYLSLATDEDGGRYLVRFRFFKSRSGKIRAVRELYELNEDLIRFYEGKKEKYIHRPRRRRKKKTSVAAEA